MTIGKSFFSFFLTFLFFSVQAQAQNDLNFETWKTKFIENRPLLCQQIIASDQVSFFEYIDNKLAKFAEFKISEQERTKAEDYFLFNLVDCFFKHANGQKELENFFLDYWGEWLVKAEHSYLLARAINMGLKLTLKDGRFRFSIEVEELERLMTTFLDQAIEKEDFKTVEQVYLFKAYLGYIVSYSMSEVSMFMQKAVKAAERAYGLNAIQLTKSYLEYANHLYGVERDLEQSAIYFQKIMDINPNYKKEYLVAMLRIYNDLGDNERGLECATQLINMHSADNSPNLILTYLTLVDIYMQKGELALASVNLEKGRQLFELNKKEMNSGYLSYFEGLYLAKELSLKAETGDTSGYAKAIKYSKSLGHNQFQYLEAIIKLAILNNDDAFIAEIEAEQIKSIDNDYSFSSLIPNNVVFNALGEAAFHKTNYKKALDYYEKAITLLSGTTGKEELLLDAIREHNDGLSILKNKMQAQIAYRKAVPTAISLEEIYKTITETVALLDRIRQKLTTKGSKELLLNDAPWIFEQAILVCHDLYKETNDPIFLEEAFSFAEKNKAILLLDALKENEAKAFAGLPDSLLKKEQIFENEIRYYHAEKIRAETAGNRAKADKYAIYLNEKRGMVEKLKKQLERDYPRYFKLKYELEPVAVNALQVELKKQKITLLEYVVGEKNLFIFVLDGKELKLHKLDITNNFNEWIGDYYNQLTNHKDLKNNYLGSFQRFCSKSHSLYQQLIQTVFPNEIPTRLLIVADGGLSYIPFETFLTTLPKKTTKSFSKLDYLIKQATIGYAYSATLWDSNIKQQSTKKIKPGVFALAPSYQNQNKTLGADNDWVHIRKGLVDLNGAVAEVKWLQENFRGKFIFDKAAGEGVFKKEAANYAILHLAMHGVVNEDNSAYSGLYFTETGDSREDDILFAYEISGLKLHSELIVLSACQTGFGKYQNGEGVVSLGRSFMYAGCPAILMTLWEVNDQSALFLMQQFYLHLEKGAPKDLALQQAKLDFLENADGIAAHPYFWSNFVLIGDAKPVKYINSALTGYFFPLMGLGGLVLVGLFFFIWRRPN